MKRKKSESASSMEPSPEPKRSILSGYLTGGKEERDRLKQTQEKESRSNDSKMPEMGSRKQLEKQEHAQDGKAQVCGIF